MLEDFSDYFTVEIYGDKGWEVVWSFSSERDALNRWLKELRNGEYVRIISPGKEK
jgi:hypothetical protein